MLPTMPTDHVEATEVCDSCKRHRALSDFDQIVATYDPLDSPPVICRQCRTGVAHRSTIELTQWENRVLHKYVAERKTVSQVAREMGCRRETVANLINGKSDNGEFRRAVRMVFEEAGVDVYTLARKLSESLEAKKPVWNRETSEFEMFPDNSAQGSAQERGMKLFNLYEKETRESTPTTVVAVKIETNIGSSEPMEDEPGVYTIDVTPDPDQGKMGSE